MVIIQGENYYPIDDNDLDIYGLYLTESEAIEGAIQCAVELLLKPYQITDRAPLEIRG